MLQLLLAVIYMSFISLGLPDSLLGSAWPAMHGQLGVSLSSAGIISMTISIGTVISSLQSDRLTKRFGAGKVTAVSVAMTAAALYGFSMSSSFWMLCLWAVPYGLGAGSVDASLNNYVALHYASRHMSWLHCMWGVGASVGPWIMSAALTAGQGWEGGYRAVAIIQTALTAILLLSLPLWKKSAGQGPDEGAKPMPLRSIVKIPGVWEVMAAFFCYCALEQTAGLWAASYLTLHYGMNEGAAAGFAGMFFIGITAGRLLSGFLTMKLPDVRMVRLGMAVLAAAVLSIMLPLGAAAAIAGLVCVGLGCAPVYPCLIHSTPDHFGAENSQAIIGVQMASAYVGTSVMPPLFGLLSRSLGVALLPYYLAALLLVMLLAHERLVKKTARPCEGQR